MRSDEPSISDDTASLHEVIEAASELREAATALFVNLVPEFTLRDLVEQPTAVVAVACIRRQTDALDSAVVLARAGHGHIGLPLVRPACEERIWLAYLARLTAEQQMRLLHLMNMREGSSTVEAQQQYMGSRLMGELGFPKAFVRSIARSRRQAEESLVTLGAELGWPPDGPVPPSVGWISSQAGLSRTYGFLYSASSKGVHFSPLEQFRSGWMDELNPDATVKLFATPYIEFRTRFVLRWLCSLLIETLNAAQEAAGLFGDDLGDESDARTLRFLAATRRVGETGRVPIVLAAEFNLSQ